MSLGRIRVPVLKLGDLFWYKYLHSLGIELALQTIITLPIYSRGYYL